MTREAEAVALGLTKAQRQAVLWCPEDGSAREWEKGSEVSFFCLAKIINGDPAKEVATIYALTERGQSATRCRGLWPNPTWRLTPLGIEVRRILQERNG